MADIKLFLQNYAGQDDDQDEDDYSKYYESSMLDQTNPDDLLTPLEKLHKYCTSENIFTRQMVARSIVETVQSVTNQQECLSLLEIITKLSDDIEPSVRCELMEQLPSCCMVISDLRLIGDAIPGFILPVMVKYLTDNNNQVRKLSQNALLQLMEQMLIHADDVEKQICPVLLTLTEADSGDDFRTEAVGLMTKITSVVGGEASERLFLKRFGDLCADPLFHVRKVCASNFGEFASVVCQDTTEKSLLPLFARLCEDGVWGVRKACAETFMSVSGTCSRDVKYDTLSPLFVGLLCDKSRWVQMAAYQALGQFIATFADPINSGFGVNEDGQLMQVDLTDRSNTPSPQPLEDPSLESDRQTRGEASSATGNTSNLTEVRPDHEAVSQDMTYNAFSYWRSPIPQLDIPDDLKSPSSQTTETSLSKNNDTSKNQTTENNAKTSERNTNPVTPGSPQSEFVKSYVIIETEASNDNTAKSNTEEKSMQEEKPPIDVVETKTVVETTAAESTESTSPTGSQNDDDTEDNKTELTSLATNVIVSPSSTSSNESISPNPLFVDIFSVTYNAGASDDEMDTSDTNTSYTKLNVDLEILKNQRIVPPALLEHYISMVEPSKAQTIDGELPRHCAFTLPGVALALGRHNWHCLKDTYECLSTDMQWKVRRTLAFSIHDLALILGEDICVNDLVPVFNAFLKDLDEVRIGVLKHLYQFINLLPSDLRKRYLQVFGEFQKTDNTRNWRFRQDLAQQLMSLVNLYTKEELYNYISPVALDLASDKVAEVRENAYHLLCILMQKLCSDSTSPYSHKFPTSIVTLGTHHQHWVKRKACAQIYLRFLEGHWDEPSDFAKDFLPSLLNLCADDVANVRIVASKAILAFIATEFFQSLPEDDETRKLVESALEALQGDDDRDVRFFSGGKVENRLLLNDSSEVDYNETYVQGGIRIIQRGIHEYAISDDDDIDDDTELVEEVYMEEQPTSTSYNHDEIVVEEYYVEQEPHEYTEDQQHKQQNGQVYVEEIIEEIIETVGESEEN